MCKLMTFPFIKNCVKSTVTINTSFLLTPRNSTTPYVDDTQKPYPDYIYKVPVKNCKIQCCTTTRCCSVQGNKAHSQVLKTLNYVKTVKTGCLIKSTSKHTITKSKSCAGIFQILTINKQEPK